MTYKEKNSIKSWAKEDRPRERFMLNGVKSLTNSELIAILLRSGTKESSAVDLSKKLLDLANNNLNSLGKLDIHDFTNIKGIGPTKAITLMSALELGRRRKTEMPEEKLTVKNSQSMYNIVSPLLSDLKHEEFWVVHLNRANRVISKQRISQGAVSGTIVDIRIIIKQAVNILSSSIIICHNHPSGNLNPSKPDSDLTKKIKSACSYFDIQLLDHIIVGDNQYYSFADNGIL